VILATMDGNMRGAPGRLAALVIGGGPAGLFLAADLARRFGEAGVDPVEAKVTLLEGGPRPGRKLLASGGGQCNITNAGPIADFIPRYGERGRFLRKALYAFTNEDLVAWFAARGLECVSEPGGKIFPSSRRATEVLKALEAECALRCVSILSSARARSMSIREDGSFIVEASRSFTAAMAAITTGGRSYPATGSEGDGYALAASLGHAIIPPRPALTAIRVRDFPLASLAGLSFEKLGLSLWRGGRKLRDTVGDLLVTHEGLSGPGILDASRYMGPGDLVVVDFCGLGREGLREAFAAKLASAPRALPRNLIAEYGLPKRLAERLCELAGIDPETTASTLRRECRETLVGLASAFPATIEALGGWDKAMVTAGGVDTSEVNPSTMESKLLGGLFFAGEVLDIDGDTGGFNLQAAFSTAALAAKAMADRFLENRIVKNRASG
jgi:predicted Rossmann fold flavoprotein